MTLEKYEYPATGAVTNSFLPTRNPAYDGRRQAVEWATVLDRSSGKKTYRYDEGIKVRRFRLRWSRFPDAERVNYEAFRDAALGADIKFTDWSGAAHTVFFGELKYDPQPSAGNRWTWEDELIEEL